MFPENPHTFISVRAGYRGDFVYNRKLQDINHTIDTYSLYCNEGVFTMNFCQCVDIYAFCGSCSQNLDSKYSSSAGTPNYETVNFETKSIWGAGGKITLWCQNWGCNYGTTYLGLDACYEKTVTENSETWLHNDTIVTGGGAAIVPATATYYEWQVACMLGHKVAKVTPYVAIKWSAARASLTGQRDHGSTVTTSLLSATSQRHLGWAVGATFVDWGCVAITAEARFVDEKAATISADIRF